MTTPKGDPNGLLSRVVKFVRSSAPGWSDTSVAEEDREGGYSRQALKDFYGFLHDHVKESVTVLNFAASETLTAIDAVIRVEGVKALTREALDARGLHGFFPITAGEVQEMRQFIFYTIMDGLIARVECALAPMREDTKA